MPAMPLPTTTSALQPRRGPFHAHGRLLVVGLTRDRIEGALGHLIGIGLRVVERHEHLSRRDGLGEAELDVAHAAAPRHDIDAILGRQPRARARRAGSCPPTRAATDARGSALSRSWSAYASARRFDRCSAPEGRCSTVARGTAPTTPESAAPARRRSGSGRRCRDGAIPPDRSRPAETATECRRAARWLRRSSRSSRRVVLPTRASTPRRHRAAWTSPGRARRARRARPPDRERCRSRGARRPAGSTARLTLLTRRSELV